MKMSRCDYGCVSPRIEMQEYCTDHPEDTGCGMLIPAFERGLGLQTLEVFQDVPTGVYATFVSTRLRPQPPSRASWQGSFTSLEIAQCVGVRLSRCRY